MEADHPNESPKMKRSAAVHGRPTTRSAFQEAAATHLDSVGDQPSNADITSGREDIELLPTNLNGLDAEDRKKGKSQRLQKAWRRSRSPLGASALLRRLGSLRSPVSPTATSSSNYRARRERYSTLEEGDGEDDQIGIDISTLAGMGFQLSEMPDPKSAPLFETPTVYKSAGRDSADSLSHDKTQDNTGKLGDGMVVGAELQIDPPAALVRRAASSRRLSLTAVAEIERAKSVRYIGQNLAQERQFIVAVNEPVDLSSFDGAQVYKSISNQSLNTLFESEPMTKSYFFPNDPEHPNWKPFFMSQIYISVLIIVSLALGGIQEWLCRHSIALAAKNQGIISYDQVADVSLWNFFCWKYLPSLIFVGYGVLWQIMDYEIKRLEPYYQMSQPNGSTASASLNLDYLTLWSYLVPLKAIKLRHWAISYSAIGSIMATTVAPSLQGPSVTFTTNHNCLRSSNSSAKCPPESQFFVRIVPGWSRALTISLAVTAVFGILLLVQLRRKSGLLSDPKGIAGIASMATKSHILNDFQGMDLASHRKIHKRLQHRRFVLHKSTLWQGEYIHRGEPYQEITARLENPHPFMLRLKWGVPFIVFMTLYLLAIPVINFTRARAIPNNAPWLPILVATVIKMVWTTFEFDVRMLEPFYILSKGRARPEKTLTLDYQGTVYGWFPIKALFNGHFLVALVGFSSILLDVLTVAVSSFSVNGAAFLHRSRGEGDESNQDETFKSFLGSVGLSIAILSFVIVTAVLVYMGRRHPFLPRQPSTIAAVLAFIFASNMLDDFIDTERLTNRQMESKLKAMAKTYGLGWFKGRDGKMHCAIDEEPMRSRYVHGVPYPRAQAPWERGDDQEFV